MFSALLATVLLAQTVACDNPAPVPARDLAFTMIAVDGSTWSGALRWNGSLDSTNSTWIGPINPDGSQIGARITAVSDGGPFAESFIVTLTTLQGRYTLFPDVTPAYMPQVAKTFSSGSWQMEYDFTSVAWLVGIKAITIN